MKVFIVIRHLEYDDPDDGAYCHTEDIVKVFDTPGKAYAYASEFHPEHYKIGPIKTVKNMVDGENDQYIINGKNYLSYSVKEHDVA